MKQYHHVWFRIAVIASNKYLNFDDINVVFIEIKTTIKAKLI